MSTKEELVGELTLSEFTNMLTHFLDNREQSSNKQYRDIEIGKLTVEQFTRLMTSIAETKAYMNSVREEEITKRIFKDADHLVVAGIPPFRIRSLDDVEAFSKNMKDYFSKGGSGCFVAAAALLLVE